MEWIRLPQRSCRVSAICSSQSLALEAHPTSKGNAQAAREEAVKTIRCERPDDIIVVDHPDTLDGLMSIKSPCHPHHIVIGEVKFVESAFTAGATAQREADAKVAEEEGMKRAGEKIYASYAGGFGRDIAHAISSAPLCQPGDGHVA